MASSNLQPVTRNPIPYLSPKIIAVLLMGFASGLPYLLVGATMGAWLTESGLDKATVGMFAWVSIPATFKFLWAPIFDHIRLPILGRMGRRRSWLLLIQAVLAACIFQFAALDPLASSAAVAWVAVVIAALSASQDVVIDAFRAEYLDKPQYGEGAAVAVFGYRLGMLMAGGGALAIADIHNWGAVFTIMAGIMAACMVITLAVREPAVPMAVEMPKGSAKEWLKVALVVPFVDFMQRFALWPWMLLFIVLYRLPDGFIAFMATPYYLEMGFDKLEIAGVAKVYGFAATMAGMVLGGWLLRTWDVLRCLWVFGIAQVGTNLIYLLLGVFKGQLWALMVVISVDNFASGLLTAAMVAYLMSLCNLSFTATQYALLSALATLSSRTVSGFAGMIAEAHGYDAMFMLSAMLSLPALVVLWWVRRPSMHILLRVMQHTNDQNG